MATYAAYRHIELDKVGYSKKRVRNPPSDIFNVLCTPPKANGTTTPRRSPHNDSFTRLFGAPENSTPPRRSSLTKHDVKNRNPVTGNGVDSWDCRPASRNNSPRIHNERNPVTGEYYTIVSPASTPTKGMQNGFSYQNGSASPSPQLNGNNNNNNNINNNNNNNKMMNGNGNAKHQPLTNGITNGIA